MKLDCGPTREQREAKMEQWHDWFAWWPTRLGSHDCRWLETIERRGRLIYRDFGYNVWRFEYRAKSPETAPTAPPPAKPHTD